MESGDETTGHGTFGSSKPQQVFEAGPVAACEEEASLLRPCISDFSSDGPRLTYKNWLLERGEVAKASVLDATVQAYESGGLDALKGLPQDTSWSRMLGLTLLRSLITATEGGARFHRLKFKIIPYLRPALAVEYTPMKEAPSLGSSYFWGKPDLAPAEAWPTVSQCSDAFGGLADLPQDFPCAFVGQIAWRDVRGTIFGQHLPRAGGFSIFAFTEVHELGIMETVIRPWFPEGPMARRDPPKALLSDPYGDGSNGPFLPHEIKLTEVLSLPDLTEGPFADVLPGFGWNEPENDLYFALKDACGENCHGMGGYLSGTSGGDPSPSIDWLRLIVMRINPDCGVIHFGIPAEDLTTGRVDNARYVWMDWDS